MNEELLLNGQWDMRDERLSYPLVDAHKLSSQPEGWIPQPVPGDIHQGLVAAERIKEPLLGLNSRDCVWTEGRSWWLKKTFEVPSGWLSADRIEVEMVRLDSNAAIFVNDNLVGEHPSTFRPFICDIKHGWLKVKTSCWSACQQGLNLFPNWILTDATASAPPQKPRMALPPVGINAAFMCANHSIPGVGIGARVWRQRL